MKQVECPRLHRWYAALQILGADAAVAPLAALFARVRVADLLP